MTAPAPTQFRRRSSARPAPRDRSAASGRMRIDGGSSGPAAAPPTAAVAPDVAALLVRTDRIAAERDAAAAAIELVAAVGRAADARAALHELVDGLCRATGASTAAAGWVRRGRCEPDAAAGRPGLKRHTDAARRFRAALEETALHAAPVRWPVPPDADPGGAVPLSLRGLAEGEGAAGCAGVPLVCGDDEVPVAAVVLAGTAGFPSPQAVRLLTAAAGPLADAVRLARRAEGGPVRRLSRRAAGIAGGPKLWAALVGVAAAVGALFVPVPHRLHGDFTLAPRTRRVSAAPFDGLVAEGFAEAGDRVAAGAVLAQLDGRELRWDLAAAEAERAAHAKDRDRHLAAGNVTDHQLADLAVRKLDLKIATLRRRESQLDVVAQTAGVVLTAAVDRGANAPVTVGQPLYEIAPLGTLRAEVAVAPGDLPHLREGAAVTLRTDGGGGEELTGEVYRVRPAGEVRDGAVAFVAEVDVPNPAGDLRPGVRGDAAVTGGRRSLGWVLFHRPVEKLRGWLTW